MAIVTVSGETGCRIEDLARTAAQRLRFEFVSETRLNDLTRQEFGELPIPDRAWLPAATTILARAATEHHLVINTPGAEALFPNLAGVLRVNVIGRPAYRTGAVMLHQHIDRTAAATALRTLESTERGLRKLRTGKATAAIYDFDLVINSETFTADNSADLIVAAVASHSLIEHGLLSSGAESQLQFQARLQLAKFSILPAAKTSLTKKPFGHPSEQLFANLLDFYRIAWEYEPRSFPLQWDKEGKILEAFTPDFYLPESDLYVELTTMKQSLVTRKNRKVKLLRAIYPHINIQVFYQKDFQDLIAKHAL